MYIHVHVCTVHVLHIYRLYMDSTHSNRDINSYIDPCSVPIDHNGYSYNECQQTQPLLYVYSYMHRQHRETTAQLECNSTLCQSHYTSHSLTNQGKVTDKLSAQQPTHCCSRRPHTCNICRGTHAQLLHTNGRSLTLVHTHSLTFRATPLGWPSHKNFSLAAILLLILTSTQTFQPPIFTPTKASCFPTGLSLGCLSGIGWPRHLHHTHTSR